MLEVVHIHSDLKFIGDIRKYKNSQIKNTLIVFTKDVAKVTNSQLGVETLIFEGKKEDFRIINNICISKDVVIFNGLHYNHKKVLSKLPHKVKVLWRFFGFELYEKLPEIVFSKKTMEFMPKRHFFFSIKKKVGQFYHYLFHGILSDKRMYRKVDGFIGGFEEEYQYLIKYFQLPKLIHLGFDDKQDLFISYKKTQSFILGNNRSPYNNHLDVLQQINKIKAQSDVFGILFFSYGEENHYTREVRNVCKKFENLELVETFLTRPKFNEIYNNTGAFVLNCYRQMGIGNLFTAIEKGLKIYLSTNNIMYHWMINKGFIVYTINDFINDYEIGNLILDEVNRKHNLNIYNLFTKENNNDNFHQNIIKFCSE